MWSVLGQHHEGQQDRESLRGNLPLRGSLDLRKPPSGTLLMKTNSQKGTFQRFSKFLFETLSEEDFLLDLPLIV